MEDILRNISCLSLPDSCCVIFRNGKKPDDGVKIGRLIYEFNDDFTILYVSMSVQEEIITLFVLQINPQVKDLLMNDGKLSLRAVSDIICAEPETCYLLHVNTWIKDIHPITLDTYLGDFRSMGIVKRSTMTLIGSMLTRDFSDINSVVDVYNILGYNDTLFEWSLRLYRDYKVSPVDLMIVDDFFKNNKRHIKFLSRKTITAYTTGDDLSILIEEIRKIRRGIRIKREINKFNTTQRKLLADTDLCESEEDIILGLYNLDDCVVKNIIKKVSVIKDVKELLDVIKASSISSYTWNYDSFIEYDGNKSVLGLDYDLVYANRQKETVVLRINDFNTMSVIGANTGWCISRDDESWDSYIKDGEKQYVLLDFGTDRENGTIGFTLSPGNYYCLHCHLSNNDSNIDDDEFNYALIGDSGMVKGAFAYKGINMVEVLKPDLSVNFDWNISSFMEYSMKVGIPSRALRVNMDSNYVMVGYYCIGGGTTIRKMFKSDNVDAFLRSSFNVNSKKFLLLNFNKPLGDKDSIYILSSQSNCTNDESIDNVYNLYLEAPCGISILKLLNNIGFNDCFFKMPNPADLLIYNILWLDESEVNNTLDKYVFDDLPMPSYLYYCETDDVVLAIIRSLLTMSTDTISRVYSKFSIHYLIKSKPDRFNLDHIRNEIGTVLSVYDKAKDIDAIEFTVKLLIDKLDGKYSSLLCDSLCSALSSGKDRLILFVSSIIKEHSIFDLKIIGSIVSDKMITYLEHLIENKLFQSVKDIMGIERKYSVNIFSDKEEIIGFCYALTDNIDYTEYVYGDTKPIYGVIDMLRQKR